MVEAMNAYALLGVSQYRPTRGRGGYNRETALVSSSSVDTGDGTKTVITG